MPSPRLSLARSCAIAVSVVAVVGGDTAPADGKAVWAEHPRYRCHADAVRVCAGRKRCEMLPGLAAFDIDFTAGTLHVRGSPAEHVERIVWKRVIAHDGAASAQFAMFSGGARVIAFGQRVADRAHGGNRGAVTAVFTDTSADAVVTQFLICRPVG